VIEVPGGQEVFVNGNKVHSVFDPTAGLDPVDERQVQMGGLLPQVAVANKGLWADTIAADAHADD